MSFDVVSDEVDNGLRKVTVCFDGGEVKKFNFRKSIDEDRLVEKVEKFEKVFL